MRRLILRKLIKIRFNRSSTLQIIDNSFFKLIYLQLLAYIQTRFNRKPTNSFLCSPTQYACTFREFSICRSLLLSNDRGSASNLRNLPSVAKNSGRYTAEHSGNPPRRKIPARMTAIQLSKQDSFRRTRGKKILMYSTAVHVRI